MTPSAIKTTGYLVSSVSVILLGVVSWKSASEQPLLFACLIAGMALSHAGMALRWWSYQREEREKQSQPGTCSLSNAPR
ncbi:MAG: hypothetical protein JWP35_3625 [Caulobacter sp.]|nr:hypothetical protein [Caulobacter sp.]